MKINEDISILKRFQKRKSDSLSREEKDLIDALIQATLNEDGFSSLLELIPNELKRRWKILFGGEYQTILKLSFSPLPKVVRINTLKLNRKDFLRIAKKYSWSIESLKIFPSAFIVKNDEDNLVENTSEYKKGLFYIQQASSLLPVIALAPEPDETVLDIGAAPGSKTTQMAQIMHNKGKIIAIDKSVERLQILRDALKRLSIKNVIPLLMDGLMLPKKYIQKFDKVLLDGPCSCEGIIRYKTHKLIEWKVSQIARFSSAQKRLIENGFCALRPGGILVYSTCTYAPEENEIVVDNLLKKYHNAKIIPISFGVKTRSGIVAWGGRHLDKELVNAVRIYPQDINSTGFFICKIKKLDNSA